MRNKNKFFGLLIVMITLILVVAACSGGNNENNAGSSGGNSTPANEGSSNGNGDSTETEADVYEENGLPKDEEVTIRVGFLEQGYGRDWYDFAVEKFTEQFPNVSFDTTYSPNLGTILTPMIAAGDDDEIYDLFHPNFEGAGTFQELTSQARFEPLDDMWERELYGEPGVTLKSVMPDAAYTALSDLHGNGTTYNLPMGSATYGLFYDDALFTEKGWNKTPETWDEFVDLLETIKQDGIIPITYPGMYPNYLIGYAFDNYPWAISLAESREAFDEYDAHYRSAEQPVYTHELVKQQFMNVYELGQKGYFPQGVAALSHIQSQMQILRGEAALASTADWVGNEMADSTPEGFNWGFMSIPFTDNPDDPIVVMTSFGTSNMVIWKEKPDLVKAWAKEFLLYLYDMEIQVQVASAGMYPQRLDYVDEESRRDALTNSAKAVAEYAAATEVLMHRKARDKTFTAPEWNQARSNIIFEAIPAISEGRQDPIPILEQAEELVAQAWEQEGE